MKKIITVILMIFLMMPSVMCNAVDGNVIYSGNAGEFIFAPGTDYSPTDLFHNMKNVMPGDRITQKITVKNLADRTVMTEIFLRCLGADEDSEDFLSQLRMYVRQGDSDIFSGTAEKAFALNEPVSLGKFRSFETSDIEVILEVPGELDNRYASQVGRLKWEFSLKELRYNQQSVEQSSDVAKDSSVPFGSGVSEVSQKEPVYTGDSASYTIYLFISAAALSLTAVLLKRDSGRK